MSIFTSISTLSRKNKGARQSVMEIFTKSEKNRLTESMKKFNEKYVITNEELGRGTFSEVMLGYETIEVILDHNGSETRDGEVHEEVLGDGVPKVQRKKYVAIKRVLKNKLQNNKMRAMIKNIEFENELLQQLDHENIVKVYGCYSDKKQIFVVMEYLQGMTLDQMIAQRHSSLDIPQIKRIIKTLVSTLMYLRDEGYAHRDIKAQNIMMTHQDTVKILDFNLATKINDEKGGMYGSCGSLSYVAPEVLSCTPGNPYTYKCDIWSLGVLSYYLLSSGVLPFDTSPAMSFSMRQSIMQTRILSGVFEFVPRNQWMMTNSYLAKDFVHMALTVDPSKRCDYEDMLNHPWLADVKL